MLVNDAERTYTRMGDSFQDVKSWLAGTAHAPWAAANPTSRERSYFGPSWDLGDGYERCLQLGTEGWADGAARVTHGFQALPPPRNRVHKLRHDVAGHYPNVGRFMGGEPLHMVQRGHEQASRPVVTILCSSFISAAIHAENLIRYGVALCGVIEKLEASGRRVELATCFYAKANGRDPNALACGWRVKKASEALDIGTLAFALAHPGAFRRIGFAMYERCSAAQPNYGMPLGSIPPDVATMLGYEDALCIDASGMALMACTSTDAATHMVQNAINLAAGENIVEIEYDH